MCWVAPTKVIALHSHWPRRLGTLELQSLSRVQIFQAKGSLWLERLSSIWFWASFFSFPINDGAGAHRMRTRGQQPSRLVPRRSRNWDGLEKKKTLSLKVRPTFRHKYV